jgi:hypothetical protein
MNHLCIFRINTEFIVNFYNRLLNAVYKYFILDFYTNIYAKMIGNFHFCTLSDVSVCAHVHACVCEHALCICACVYMHI